MITYLAENSRNAYINEEKRGIVRFICVRKREAASSPPLPLPPPRTVRGTKQNWRLAMFYSTLYLQFAERFRMRTKLGMPTRIACCYSSIAPGGTGQAFRTDVCCCCFFVIVVLSWREHIYRRSSKNWLFAPARSLARGIGHRTPRARLWVGNYLR